MANRGGKVSGAKSNVGRNPTGEVESTKVQPCREGRISELREIISSMFITDWGRRVARPVVFDDFYPSCQAIILASRSPGMASHHARIRSSEKIALSYGLRRMLIREAHGHGLAKIFEIGEICACWARSRINGI